MIVRNMILTCDLLLLGVLSILPLVDEFPISETIK